MRIESAMYASREGLMSHGAAISVIGDNVSNSNTVGYKRSRAEFSDILAQSGSQDYMQSGSGSAVSGVRSIFTAGIIEDTGRSLDAGIEGEGFFVLGSATAPTTASFYTRAGNFSMNDAGLLISADGKPVLGYAGTATTGELSTLNLLNAASTSTPTTAATIIGNLDAREETKAAAPVDPENFRKLSEGSSAAQTIEVFDSLGTRQTVALYFTKLEGQWQVDAYVDGGVVGGTAGVPTKIGTSTVKFDTNGVVSEGGTITAATTFTGAAASSITIDFSGMTQYSGPSAQTGVIVNGLSAGRIKGYEILKSGALVATLDNGTTVQVGTLALANLQNLDALSRSGGNQFVYNGTADGALTGIPGTEGRGDVRGNALERSTVDTATEFTELVLMQRGYQGNSQVMNASSQLIQQTLQLIR